MKKIFLMFAVCAMSIAASAQTTRVLKGAVIDKDGNPLPGATVNATGGSEVTTVDADGSFSMEVPIWLKRATAQYAGMKDKTVRIKGQDVIFRMKPDKKRQWFIIANYSRIASGSFSRTHNYPGYSFSSGDGYSYIRNATFDYSGNMGGLMFGRLGKWGWYGKFNVGQMAVVEKSFTTYYNKANFDSSKGSSTDTYSYDHGELVWTVTLGVTKRILEPLHMYLGIGAGEIDRFGTVVSPEIGLIGKIKKHYLIHVGYQPMITTEGYNDGYYYGDSPSVFHTINIGLGYAF